MELSHSSQLTSEVIESEVSKSSADAAVILSGQAESRPNFRSAWISFGRVASVNVGGVVAPNGIFGVASSLSKLVLKLLQSHQFSMVELQVGHAMVSDTILLTRSTVM
jgi:hypothetical protein